MSSRSTQNLAFAYFTLLSFALDGKEVYRNVLRAHKVIFLAY